MGPDSPSTPQVRQEEGDGIGSHRGAAIGMQVELTRQDALFGATVLDEPLGQFRQPVRHSRAGRPFSR
jgi:hypothetical protein